MTVDMGKQRFTNAVRCLAEESGPIKERLMIAYISQLSALNAKQDLPAELVAEFDRILIRLGEDQVQGDQGNAAKQLKKMSDEEAAKISAEIFGMFCAFMALLMRTKRGTPGSAEIYTLLRREFAMPTPIELTPSERKLLLEMLNSRLGELRQEVHHSAISTFKTELKESEVVLRALVEKIQAADHDPA